MTHPTVQYKYSFQQDPKTIYKALLDSIKNTPGFELENDDGSGSQLSATFTTPTCGWIDLIQIQINKSYDGTGTQVNVSCLLSETGLI